MCCGRDHRGETNLRASKTAATGFVAAVLSAIAVAPAYSQSELNVGLGVGYAPESAGSDEYRVVPLPSIDYRADWGGIRSTGLGVEVDFIASPRFSAGPLVRYDGGRNDLYDVDDPIVRDLAPVDAALEVGAAFGFAVPLGTRDGRPSWLLNTRVAAVQGLDGGHEGVTVETTVGVLRPSGSWTLGANISAVYGDDDYQQAYFGVTPSDALATGLADYTPDAGFRSVGANLVVARQITERWGVNLIGGYSRLLGDAADSPIVTQAGDENQTFMGVGVRYRMF